MRMRLVRLGEGGLGRGTTLEVGQALTVGRDLDRDIFLPGDGVAPWHCDVGRDAAGAWLRDRTSEASCRLNGERVGPGELRRLRPGDLLEVGKAQLRLTAHVHVPRAWLRDNGGAVLQLARAIAAGADFAAMPVLADALEEAGCADADFLAYCRVPGSERCARWALGLLLAADVPGEG
jgi:hypothetical protein